MSVSEILHKAMAFKELSAEGSLAAVISTFTKDRDGDVMTREAFQGSEGKSIPMVWSHNWDQPIGKGLVKVNDESAEFHGNFNLDTTAGLEAYKTVKAMGDLQQYSIGFRIIDSSWDKKDGESIRVIKGIELFEASPVLVGAAYNTGTIAIKTFPCNIDQYGNSVVGTNSTNVLWLNGDTTEAHTLKWEPAVLSDPALADRLAALESQLTELREAIGRLETKSKFDIPDLDTPERKAQLADLDRLLATVKLEG